MIKRFTSYVLQQHQRLSDIIERFTADTDTFCQFDVISHVHLGPDSI